MSDQPNYPVDLVSQMVEPFRNENSKEVSSVIVEAIEE